MQRSLQILREAVLKAATESMSELLFVLAGESAIMIQDFQWEWNGPANPRERNIVDTEQLMHSCEPSDVVLSGNRITASLKWDPVDELTGFHYARLVHNGKKDYFEGHDEDESTGIFYDYTARPWTFMLTPPQQRNISILQTPKMTDPETLPTMSWDRGLDAFKKTFAASLQSRFKVIK